jgi:hypothetical protein
VKKHLSKYSPTHTKNSLPSALFEPYKKEICDLLRGKVFDKFMESEKYSRFCQWKNFELNIQVGASWLLPDGGQRATRSSVAADDERFQCASNHRTWRLRRSLRVSEGRHGQDVSDEREHGRETRDEHAGRSLSGTP